MSAKTAQVCIESEGLVEGHIPLAWMITLNTILDHFGPMVAKMLQMVSFDAILDHFGKWGQFAPTSKIDVRFPAQLRLHSKWLSIRNSFGITPKGPMGPSPQGRRRRPWDPLGPFWCPWVPLAPLGPLPPLGLWVLGSLGGLGWGWGPWGAFGSKGSAPCRSEGRASRKLGCGADFAGENILGRRHAL